jgi:putative hydrolase of the HAD superfamily
MDRYFVDLRTRQIAYSVSDEQSRRVWTDLYAQFLRQNAVGPAQVELLTTALYAMFVDHASYQPFDDAVPVLRSLRQRGFIVGVTSNWERWLDDLLVTKEIRGLIDFTAISGSIGYEKPDRRIFDAAVAVSGVPAGSILHVGDSIESDLRGASAAGIRAVLLDRTGVHVGSDLPRIGSLWELLEWPELASSLT